MLQLELLINQNKVPGLINTLPLLKHLITELKEVDYLAVDTETTSLDKRNCNLIVITIYAEKDKKVINAFIPLDLYCQIDQLSLDHALSLNEIFSDSSKIKIFHNASFDVAILRRYGFIINNIDDTRILAHTIDENRSLELKSLARTVLKIEDAIKFSEDWKGEQIRVADPVKLAEYALADSKYTYKLYEKFMCTLNKDQKLHNLYFKLDRPVIEIFIDMEMNGISIDLELVDSYKEKITILLEQSLKNIYEIVGEEINVNSTQQLQKVLMDLNAPTVKQTDSGDMSTDEESLNILATHQGEDYASFAEAVSDYRKLEKLRSTYIEVLLEKTDRSTGRLYGNFNQVGTKTGRASSSGPNLQNISARGKYVEDFNIRSCFVAESKKLLLVLDYSQLELRIMACMSLDSSMLDSFDKGEDIHTRTASELFKVSLDKVAKAQRSLAKNMNFGIIYGIGPRKLAKNSGISMQEAQQYLGMYFKRFAGVKEYLDRIKDELHKKGYVLNMFGRYRRVLDAMLDDLEKRGRAERQGINATIQGGAADLVKAAMLKVWNKYKDTDLKFLLQVHDELVFECNEENAEKYFDDVKNIMENPIRANLPVKFEVSGKICKNWSDGK